MDELIRDVRFGVRTLLKNRGFAVLAILTLGLGIGANTAIFSVISGVLLKPLPYTSGDRLVLIRQSALLAGRPVAGISIKELYDYREQAGDFDNLVEYHQMTFDLLNRGEPDRVGTGVVSHNFFDVLGIKPILGRTFVEEDDRPGADAVLVLSYSYWQKKFGGDPGIVGQVFQMNDRPHTVIGVLPNVPHYPQENDVYMSVSACPFRADDPNKRPTADARIVSPEFFPTIGVPLAAGRMFTDGDTPDGPRVVVINKAMTRYWGKTDAVGSRVSFDEGKTWATVVGVVGDVKQFGLSEGAVAQVYSPLTQAQGGIGGGRVLVRTVGEPLAAAKIVREDVHAIDPNMPVVNVQTLQDIRDRYLATPRLTATLLSIFALLAMLVTLTGITGVLATSVSRRTQEFGLRMALGARRNSVLRMVIGQGLALVGVGLLIGIGSAMALARVLASLLFETTVTDPLTLAGVAAAFLAGGLVACVGPAWRATTADPMVALRAD